MVYRNGEAIITNVQIQSVNLTWDEYQALPATKLTDGVYYNITDWEQSTLDIVNTLTGENIALQNRIAELENANTYSTDEVRIGTYMGKPLYRRVVDFNTPSSANTWAIVYNIPNITPISYKGHMINAGEGYIEPFPYGETNYDVNIRYKPSSGDFYCYARNARTNWNVHAVIEYTKEQ